MTYMLHEFKCEKCGFVVKAAIRPRLCDKCKTGRRHLRKIESKPLAA